MKKQMIIINFILMFILIFCSIKYESFAAEIPEVDGKTILKMTVSKLPVKKEYLSNEQKLDLTSGKIEFIYTDNSRKSFDMDSEENLNLFTYEGFVPGKFGEQEIRVKYKKYSSKFKIKVIKSLIDGGFETNIINNPPVTPKNDSKTGLIIHPSIRDAQINKNVPTYQITDTNNNRNLAPGNRIFNGDITLAPGFLPQAGSFPIVIFSIIGATVVLIYSVVKLIISKRKQMR